MGHRLHIKSTAKKKSIQGFTLIEMAMVMVIVGIVISIMMTVLPTIMKTGKIKEAQAKLTKFDYALQGYAIANSRLPFAASGTDGVETPNTFVGYLPYVTLRLSEGKDVWGQTIRYAVHSSLTANVTPVVFCTNINAAISAAYSAAIVHTRTDDATPISENQSYVLVSGGPKDLDGANAYLDLFNGTATAGSPRFNADNKIQALNYDDLVKSMSLTVFSGKNCIPAP